MLIYRVTFKIEELNQTNRFYIGEQSIVYEKDMGKLNLMRFITKVDMLAESFDFDLVRDFEGNTQPSKSEIEGGAKC